MLRLRSARAPRRLHGLESDQLDRILHPDKNASLRPRERDLRPAIGDACHEQRPNPAHVEGLAILSSLWMITIAIHQLYISAYDEVVIRKKKTQECVFVA